MKEQERVAHVFTSIASEWDKKGNIVKSSIGQKNPYRTEYQNWIQNGMNILDVGCGAGKNLMRIDSQYNDCELIGIDISEKMIEIALQQSISGQNEVSFEKTDFMDYDTNLKFDVIIFNYVLHHVSNPKMVISKACKFLRKNGIIMVTVPGTDYLKETFPYFEKMPTDSVGRFSIRKIENIFSNTGLIQLLYKKSIFLMQFESYEQYVQYLKSIGTYQKIVGYYDKAWAMEYENIVLTSFLSSKYITGHYDLYVYCMFN